MVSSKEILEKTGIKNIKTLTRWHKQGIIPKPVISTHPSGRGKMAYWPDWVLQRCMKIVELRKQGHSLGSAVTTIEVERIRESYQEIKKKPSISDILESKQFKLKEGKTHTLLDLFLAVIVEEVKRFIKDPDLITLIVSKLKEGKAIDLALAIINAGFNPVLVFDGTDAEIMTDFLISHRHRYERIKDRPYFVVPLLAPLSKAFSIIGKELPEISGSLASPAPKIWIRDGDTILEYSIYLVGPTHFELIRESAKTLAVFPDETENDESAK